MSEQDFEIAGLRALYQANAAVKAILTYAASRKYNSVEMSVERTEVMLRRGGDDISRREVIEAFKALEDLGLGEFIIGRRGAQSRLKWHVPMIDAGRAAQGIIESVRRLADDELLPPEPSEPLTQSDELPVPSMRSVYMRHAYNLRPGYAVTIELPTNLSEREASRLAEFIKTLPFDQS
jgi:hypothetical protein